jgi:hypothetical protein
MYKGGLNNGDLTTGTYYQTVHTITHTELINPLFHWPVARDKIYTDKINMFSYVSERDYVQCYAAAEESVGRAGRENQPKIHKTKGWLGGEGGLGKPTQNL